MAAPEEGTPTGEVDPLTQGAGEPPVAEEPSIVQEHDPSARGTDGTEEPEFRMGVNRPTGVPDAIEFIGVHKSFGSNHVLRGLNMGLPEGKISMILGPSGTGKSVCIKHIVGLLYPDEGDVIVQGRSIPSLPDAE